MLFHVVLERLEFRTLLISTYLGHYLMKLNFVGRKELSNCFELE